MAAEITQQTTDRQQLVPLVKSVRSTAQATPETITADAGYWDTTSLLDPSLQGIQVLVTPDSNPQPPGAPLPPTAPRNEQATRMREALTSQEGKARYALRKSTVEPVFGQIKEARGIRRFGLRTLPRWLGMETHLRHAQSFEAVPLPCCCYRCRRLEETAVRLIRPLHPPDYSPRQNANPMSVTPSQRSAPRAWISLLCPLSPIRMTSLRHTLWLTLAQDASPGWHHAK